MDTDLEERIQQLGLSKSLTNKCRNLIRIIDKESNENGWASLPRNYLQEIFNKRFYEFLNPMLEKGIIEKDNRYSSHSNFSKSYKINRKNYLNPLSLRDTKSKEIKEQNCVSCYTMCPQSLLTPYFTGVARGQNTNHNKQK